MSENRNITLSLPRDLLRRIKRLAANQDTSVSALTRQALTRLADESRRYSAARKRSLAAMRSSRSLGTSGRRTWSRDELHERWKEDLKDEQLLRDVRIRNPFAER